MTPQEFSAKIKAKYPAYQNIDDVELAKKIVEKYPTYASQVNFNVQPVEKPKTMAEKIAPVTDIYNEGAKKVTEKINQAGERFANSPNTPVGNLIEKPAILGKGVADVTTQVVKTAFEPLAKPVGALISFLSDKISDIPMVQRLATTNAVSKVLNTISNTSQTVEQAKKAHPDLADALDTLVTIGGTVIGEKPLQTATESVVNTSKNLAEKGINLAGKVDTRLGGEAAQKALEATKNSAISESLDLTKPLLNKKESIAAFEKAGQKGGVTQTNTLGKYSVEPTLKDVEIAKSVQGLVSKKNGPIDNIVNINQEISRISDSEIKPFLEKNYQPKNPNTPPITKQTIDSYIKKNAEVANFIKADPVLQKTYDLARQSMIDELDKKPKTMLGLWEARKSFDNVAERQVGNLDPLSEKASAIKQAVLDTRRAVNDYIAENTPNGDENFKAQLKTLSNMYEARGNIAEQNYKLLDKNVVQRWIKQNPSKAKLLKYGLGVVGLEQLIKRTTGVGI